MVDPSGTCVLLEVNSIIDLVEYFKILQRKSFSLLTLLFNNHVMQILKGFYTAYRAQILYNLEKCDCLLQVSNASKQVLNG